MPAGETDRGMCPAPSNAYPMAAWHLARLLAFAARAQGKPSSDDGQAAVQELAAVKVSLLYLSHHRRASEEACCFALTDRWPCWKKSKRILYLLCISSAKTLP